MVVDAAEALAVVNILASAGIRHAISGGWGVDALLGRQTREHGDLDVAVDAEEIESVLSLLGARGYVLVADQRPARLELHTPGGRVIDIHPVAWDLDGHGRQQGFDGRVFEYPAESILNGRIDGESVSCIDVQLQLRFHDGYKPSERDIHDLGVLIEAFGSGPVRPVTQRVEPS